MNNTFPIQSDQMFYERQTASEKITSLEQFAESFGYSAVKDHVAQNILEIVDIYAAELTDDDYQRLRALFTHCEISSDIVGMAPPQRN